MAVRAVDGDPGDMNDAPPGGPATESGHPGTDSFFDTLRRIDLRRTEDGWIGGVAAGIARRLGLDPLVVRAGFVLLGLVFGFGLLLYLVGWLLIPDTRHQTHLERGMRQGDGSSILLLVVTALVAISSLPWWGGGGGWFGGWGGWWFGSLLVLSLVVWGAWTLWERRDGAGTSPTAMTGGAATGPTPPPPYAGSGETYPVAGPGAGQTAPPPGSSAPFTAGPSAPPPPPPAPPRPRRRSGGPMAGLIATGLALVSYGSLHWAADTYDWPGNHYVVAVAGTLAVLGTFVLVLGLVGRKGGFPGFLAALALVATVVTAPLPANLNLSGGVGDRDWTPASVSDLEPFRLGIGEATLDLRGLDPDELNGQEVVASVGIGQLVVIIPEDITVHLRANSAVGGVEIDAEELGIPRRPVSGLGVGENRVIGSGEPDLVLVLDVGLGDVQLERSRS